MRCEPQIGECILRDIDALISSAQTSHPRWHDSIFWHSEKCLLWLKNVNLKNKKQCETARGFPLVTVLSPLHWSQSTNSRKRAGLWLRCEQAPPMWVWRHCLAASCQERKNTWQHWKRELIGLEAFDLYNRLETVLDSGPYSGCLLLCCNEAVWFFCVCYLNLNEFGHHYAFCVCHTLTTWP